MTPLSTISVQKYKPTDKRAWNDFLTKAKNATFLFHRDFMDYHSNRFEDHSLMIYKDDKLVALLPANNVNHILYSHQGLSYGGFIFRSSLRFKTVCKFVKTVLAYLEKEGVSEIHYKALPKIYASSFNEEVDYLSFLLQAEIIRSEVSVSVNLKDLPTLSKDRKAGIKRGINHQLEVRKTSDFEAFWEDLLIPKLNTKHSTNPVHTVKEISLLANRFPEHIKQFNVYHENQLVAGTTIFETKHVAHSQYIASNHAKNTLGSLDFLHHYLIEYYRAKGLTFFDFGISNENQGKKINEGLLYWKEGFGGRATVNTCYKIETKNHLLLNDVFI